MRFVDPVTVLQITASGWLGRFIDVLPVGYAFGAGMMSAVNPCGFTILPGYLALFLGRHEEGYRKRSVALRVAKAIGLSLVMSAGFVFVFAAVGGLIAAGGRAVIEAMPWVSVSIGVSLIFLGVWLLAGRHLSSNVLLRWASRMPGLRLGGSRGFFLYGVAFAICSVGCTLPIFLVVVGSAVASGNFVGALHQFVSYGLGMGFVITALTLAIATVNEGAMIGGLRRAMPYLHYVAAVFVILAGCYILYYWLIKGGLLA